jgi:putative ABC transport system permease protein
VREPDRLVYLEWRGSDLTTKWGSRSLMSYPLCRDLQDQQQLFEGVFCRHPTTVNLSTGQQPTQFRGEIVSGSYFAVLGVAPRLGRLIDRSDDLQPGGHPVVGVTQLLDESS